MAKVLANPTVSINGVDLTDHVSSCDIEEVADELDVTCFTGSATPGWKETIPGMKDGTMTFEMYQDFAAGKTDATISALFGSPTPVTILVRATNAAKSATNPEYQMSGINLEFHPVNGTVADPLSTTVVFRNASPTGIVRAIA